MQTATAINESYEKAHIWEEHYPANIKWGSKIETAPVDTILDKAVQEFATRPAINFADKQISYAELGQLVEKIAIGLQKHGVKKGIKVGLFLPNTPYSVAFYYGILKAGGTVVNYNPLYVERELSHQIEDSETDFMVTLDAPALFEKADAVLKNTRLKSLIICPSGEATNIPPTDSYIHYDSLITTGDKFNEVNIDPISDIAVLQYTGGTTGVPKGAMLTHANLYANAMQMYYWHGKLATPGQEKIIGIIPLFHVFSMTVVMNLSLILGMEIILLPKFDPATIIPFLKEKQPQFFPAVPAIYNAIASMADADTLDLSCIKFGISGGAPLPAEVKRNFEQKTGAKIGEGYGLTETSPVVACSPMEGDRVKTGSIGQPIPGTIVEIINMDDNTTPMPTGERGEVCVRGPQVMKGYYNKPEDTAQTIKNGRLHTGDVGYLDEEGYIFLVDRLKDVVLVRGYNVYPRQVEEAIYMHQAVEECVVAGVPDQERGETVWAWIKLLEGKSLDEEEMKKFLHDKLSPIEIPRKIIIRTEPLPKTSVGKLSKKLLLEQERIK